MNTSKINKIKTKENYVSTLSTRKGALSRDVYALKGKTYRVSIVESFFKNNGAFLVEAIYKVENKKTGKVVFAGKEKYEI
jgi:hypothetical protein